MRTFGDQRPPSARGRKAIIETAIA